MKGRTMNQQPIFILGSHKSGTSLMLSLLNGHTNLFTIPIESHYFQNMHYWVDNEYRFTRPKKLDRRQIIESFSNWIHICNNRKSRFGGAILNREELDEDRFRKIFSAIKTGDDDKKRIEVYFEAIYGSLNNKKMPGHRRIVEKSVENAEFAEELMNLFPEAKFIHLMRNPYSNIVSLRKYMSIDFGYPVIRRIIKTLYNNYYFLYRNKRIIKNYYIIRYEDLLSEPDKEMQSLCEFLKIPFEDVLLLPTYDGKIWKGNSTTGEEFSGIDDSNLGKWMDEITSVEVFYINKMFSFVVNDYGYKRFTKDGFFWKPARGESIKRYFANRLYKFFLKMY